mmetsp:Transcript_28587/g.60331  ORF Transcript_28587/g.60331 Transcript_28587/m.60331 type:complete len:130 (-) Transcript_28587:445-834(-)
MKIVSAASLALVVTIDTCSAGVFITNGLHGTGLKRHEGAAVRSFILKEEILMSHRRRTTVEAESSDERERRTVSNDPFPGWVRKLENMLERNYLEAKADAEGTKELGRKMAKKMAFVPENFFRPCVDVF